MEMGTYRGGEEDWNGNIRQRLGLALADFNEDGKIDLAVANDSMPEFLYRNRGDGTFEETGLTAEIAVDGDGGRMRGWYRLSGL